jgi:hypothetical protein
MDRAQDRLDIPSVTAKAQGLQSSLAVFLADEWGDELRTGSEELERVLKILEDDECGRLAVENRMAWRLNDRGRLLMHDKSPVEFQKGFFSPDLQIAARSCCTFSSIRHISGAGNDSSAHLIPGTNVPANPRQPAECSAKTPVSAS